MRAAFWYIKRVCFWVKVASNGFEDTVFIRVVNKIVFAASICITSLGGATVGTIFGAIKGQTTEVGFFKGAVIGSVAGAIAAIQLLDSIMDGQPMYESDLFGSLANGNDFMELLSPALLRACQWEVNTLENTYTEVSDIYDVSTAINGLTQNCIQQLPSLSYHCDMLPPYDFSCSICIQEIKEGECIRKLAICGHSFHVDCVDKWLIRQNSCPLCRIYVCGQSNIVPLIIA